MTPLEASLFKPLSDDMQQLLIRSGVIPVNDSLLPLWGNRKKIVLLYGSYGCFAPSQMVHTISGPVEISKIKKGALVLSHDFKSGRHEWKPVLAVFKYQIKDRIIEIKLKNGRAIRCTENHEIWDGTNWLSAKDFVTSFDAKRMETDTRI